MNMEMAKGVRDFPPEEKIVRNNVTNRIIKVYEQYGFNPLETPSFERFEILSAKFAAGEESDALKETFTFEDQGNRKLGLRFDLTLPLARFVAMNPNLKMPFKRYEIGRVFRDGPIKLGRYREFWQCDADIVGVSGTQADSEIILLALDVFESLELDAYLEVNNRKILNGILKSVGVTKHIDQVLISLDKLNKIGLGGVELELFELGVSKETTKKLTDVLDTRGSTAEILDQLKEIITDKEGLEGITEMQEVMNSLKHVQDRVKLNISLARGLSYYTGTVFEGFLKSNKIKSSICGGGRYDDMIGKFAGTKEFPAVGIAFGLEPITEFIKLKEDSLPKTVTKVFIIPIKTYNESLEIAQTLRKHAINTEIDLLDRGVSKNLNYVNTFGIPFVLFVGEEEMKAQKVKLRDMRSGKEDLLSVDEVVHRLI